MHQRVLKTVKLVSVKHAGTLMFLLGDYRAEPLSNFIPDIFLAHWHIIFLRHCNKSSQATLLVTASDHSAL